MKKLWQNIELMSESDEREAVLVCVVLIEALLLVAGARGIGTLLILGLVMFTYAVLRPASIQRESVVAARRVD